MVLPDSTDGENIAGRLRGGEFSRVVPHASGRPWIVGDWAAEDVIRATAGDRQIAMLGCASTTAGDLADALARIRRMEDFDRLSRTVPGSYHLVAAVGGVVRAQGTLSSACQIFHTTVDNVPVAANSPQLLAQLAGTGPAEELLAARLLAPWPPWPLGERPLWRRVEALGTGCWLELAPDGGRRTVRWWAPPTPDVPLHEAAPRIRAALQDAVAARARRAGPISSDLSGGMDSTSLTFLAARDAERLLTTRWEAEDPADEDRVWARTAAAHLTDAEHLVLPKRQAPLWFTGLTTPGEDAEGPFAWIRTRARLEYMAREVATRGSTVHLTGHGGDELFFTTPQYLHTLVRTHPLAAIRHVRAHRALYRWKAVPTLRSLLDRKSFEQWLAATAGTLTDPLPEYATRPDFGWGIAYRLPPWVTPSAADAARQLLRDAVDSAPAPLAPLRGQHSALQDIRLCGDTLRRVSRLTSRHGVSWQAPFTDDAVVEAALAVRFEDIADTRRYKPALAAAMDGFVPSQVLRRPTKSEYSAEAYAGLRGNRRDLLQLCEDSRLARLGMVDADALRATLVSLPPSSLTLLPLISTLACEIWLRSLPPVAGRPARLEDRHDTRSRPARVHR
ncbi:asparagine synthase-related protein [Streptomyces milbemycinicus]|uniref:asparagine synthase (glutamine-hydrolyzing) n=1 Tax=Streptomyces milbemycinicus TaxID=476552 RepID=A0ABW8LS84_9ACTN